MEQLKGSFFELLHDLCNHFFNVLNYSWLNLQMLYIHMICLHVICRLHDKLQHAKAYKPHYVRAFLNHKKCRCDCLPLEGSFILLKVCVVPDGLQLL